MSTSLRVTSRFGVPFFLVLAATSAFGLGIRIADQDPLATARGNAFAATADNPSAIYYNPAGITQLPGHNLRAGVYAITLESDFDGPTASFDTRREILAVPQMYYTLTPAESPLSYGVGLYSPYGLSLKWPANPSFGRQEGAITYLTLNPVVAWKACEAFSIAAGITLNHGEAELRQTLPFGTLRFKGDDGDVGFNVGVLLQPHPMHSFGINYRSETRLDFDGRSRSAAFGRQDASAGFVFPQNIVLGYSFRPTTNWNFEVNVDWTDWDRLNTVTLRQTPDVPFPFNWESSFFYEFGVTRYFSNGCRLSGGYIYSENSVPERFFNPIVPDSDRHIFSLGIGRTWGRFDYDLAYQLAWGPTRTINNAPSPAVNGDYEFISHAFTFSVAFNF